MGCGASGHVQGPHKPNPHHKPPQHHQPPKPQAKPQPPPQKKPQPPPKPQTKPQPPSQKKPQPPPQHKPQPPTPQQKPQPAPPQPKPQAPPPQQKSQPPPVPSHPLNSPQGRIQGIKQGLPVFPASTTLASIPLLQKEIEENLEHDYMHPVLGNYLFANGNYEWFIQKWYTQMVKGSKIVYNPYDALALCLCDNLKDKKLMEKKLDWYRKIKNTMENNINSKTFDPQKKERLKNSIYQIINGYAHLLSNTGRYDMALATYRKVIELKPGFINPRACSALIYESKRVDKEKAYEMSREILTMDGRNLWALHILARSETDPNIKIQKLKEALQIYPAVAKLASEIGMAYGGALKNCNEAIQWYKKAAEIAPGYGSCYNNIGINYQILKKFDVALDWYFKAMECDTQFVLPYKNAIDCFHTTYMSEQLILKKLQEHPKVKPFHFHKNMGLAFYQKKKYSDSIKWLQKALQAPDGKEWHYKVYNYIAAVYDDIKVYDDALLNYEKCFKLEPSFYDAYYNSALVYEYKNDIPNAIEFYKKAIEVNPQYSFAYNNLGNVYKSNDQLDEAIDCYEKAIEYLSTYTLAYANLGVTLLRLQNYPQAFQALQRAKDYLPRDNNGLTEANKAFLKETLEKFNKLGGNWNKQGYMSGEQKDKLNGMIKSFEANFKTAYAGESGEKLQDAKVLKHEILEIVKLVSEDKFELIQVEEIYNYVKRLFFQNEEYFHILPQLFIQYFYKHTFELKEPVQQIEETLFSKIKELSQLHAQSNSATEKKLPEPEGAEPEDESEQQYQVRLKKKPTNEKVNLFTDNKIFRDYGALYVEIDKVNEKAKLSLPDFRQLVESIRQGSEGIPYGVNMKMPQNQQDQFKVLLRIMEKMFKAEITRDKVKEIIDQVDKNLWEKSQKKKMTFLKVVQQIIDLWTSSITGILMKRKMDKQETSCTISDLLRGKIMFRSVEQLREAVSITEDLCERQGYTIIQFDNRLTKPETRDAVFKIKVKDAVCELQLAMKQDARRYHLTHALYELQRSPLGCIFASYIYMSKRFNYPFLNNCRDITQRLESSEDASQKEYAKAASYIVQALEE